MDGQIKSFVDLLPLEARILDLGCGVGKDTVSLERFDDVSIVGVDLSKGMLEFARKKAPNTFFCAMDARSLDFKDRSFDGVWANATLLHLSKKDIIDALYEIHRVLRDFGPAFISLQRGQGEVVDPDGRFFARYTHDEIYELLEQIGFAVLDFKEVISKKNTYGKSIEICWMHFFVCKKFNSELLLEQSQADFQSRCPLCLNNGLYLYRHYLPEISVPDLLLIKGKSFVVVPDIAPITNGHLLIISKEHASSIADMKPSVFPELNLIIKQLSNVIFKAFSHPVVFFEHGSRGLSKYGASIHHAHIHCLPMCRGMETHLFRWIRITSVTNVSELPSATRGMPYVFLHTMGKPPQVGVLTEQSPGIPSQYLRQIAAHVVGEVHWDWQKMVYGTCRSSRSKSRILSTIGKIASLL
jgi:SAM-dependent methyltransferase